MVFSMIFVEMKTLGRIDRYLCKLKGSYFPKCLLQCQEWGQTPHPCGPKARFLICCCCSTGTFVACESTKKVQQGICEWQEGSEGGTFFLSL